MDRARSHMGRAFLPRGKETSYRSIKVWCQNLSGEEATEETREETAVAPAVVPERKPSKEEYVCSVCGATVVPEEFETESGIRYRSLRRPLRRWDPCLVHPPLFRRGIRRALRWLLCRFSYGRSYGFPNSFFSHRIATIILNLLLELLHR